MAEETDLASVSSGYNLYSTTQQAILGYISVGTASLSVLGSLVMAFGIISDHRKGYRIGPLNHILLGLTFCNGIYAIGLCGLGPWAMPKEVSDYVNGADGNWDTCYASGFFLTFLLGSAWYWFALAVYYVMILILDFTPDVYAQYVEPFGHMMAVLATFLKGSVCLYYDYYVPLYTLPGLCFIGLYPPECTRDDLDVECTRGEPEEFYYSSLLWKYALPFISCGMILSTILIMYRVQTMDGHRIRTRDVGIQGLCYIAVFFTVFTPAMAVAVAKQFPESTSTNRKAYFAIALMTKVFTPLGGFLNALVFIRRRFKPLQYASPST